MHIKAQRPVLMPESFWSEAEGLSKATLMDLAWDFATTHAESEDVEKIMAAFRERAHIVNHHRRQAR